MAEHASIAGRLFFSQAERTKRPRGAEKSFYGEDARHPDGTGELKVAHRTTEM